MVAPFFGDTKKTLPAAAPAGVPDERGASDPPPHAATTSVQAPSTAAFMRRFLIATPFRMVTKTEPRLYPSTRRQPGSLRAGVACGAVILGDVARGCSEHPSTDHKVIGLLYTFTSLCFLRAES